MNLQKEDILKYLTAKKSEFNRDFVIIKLGLLGSYAQDKHTENSDIDLLVEFEPNTESLAEKKMEIKKAIQSVFGKEVDICREKYIKPYFRQQILDSMIYV